MLDGWLIFYNHMPSGAEKKVDSGSTSSGIKDAIALGLDSLPSIDPFHDIAPMVADPSIRLFPIMQYMTSLLRSSQSDIQQMLNRQTKKFAVQRTTGTYLMS